MKRHNHSNSNAFCEKYAGVTPVYDRIGDNYSQTRQEDSRWKDLITEALGDARTVLNVGAGTGSYEPTDRYVLAVEPSSTMRAQRPPTSAPSLVGVAEDLPFDDDSFDLTLAILTVHHWGDIERGVSELRRVGRRTIVLSYDMRIQRSFWLTRDYIPEIAEAEITRVPSIEKLHSLLEPAEIKPMPVWHDHEDGVMTAYWQRPDCLLEPKVRLSCSALRLTNHESVSRGLGRLSKDLLSGEWDRKYGALREQKTYDAGFRLIAAG